MAAMPKPPAHSDFVPGERVDVPEAKLLSNEASATSTKIVMWGALIMLVLLGLLLVIGPHIPSGE